MLSIIILAVIIYWTVNYVQGRNYDKRVSYGREIADHFDLQDIFENAYLGSFEFDEMPPHESLRKDVEMAFDRGVEARLAFYFAKTLPKWVLETCAKDIKLGQIDYNASYSKYIDKQLDAFVAIRHAELADLLDKKSNPSPEPVRRRRRRR